MPHPLNAWREILTRILNDFTVQENVTPPWLVNPGTRRQLKLDLYYPQARLAVRFGGLTGQRKRRLSNEEQEQNEAREDIRAQLCAAQGIALVTIDINGDEPGEVFKQLSSALVRASRTLATGNVPDKDKATLMPKLAAARQRCNDLQARVWTPDDLDVYANLWLDRQTARIVAAEQAQKATAALPLHQYREGQPVRHTAFGEGIVQRVEQRGNETYVTVAFASAGKRTFAAHLVGDKLLPIES